MQKFKTVTFGCKANKYDSALIENKLKSDLGVECVEYGQDPDFIIVNTCTVTESSDAQARQLIRSLKRKHPKAKIFVIGCYARLAHEEIKKNTGCDEAINEFDAKKIVALIGKKIGKESKKETQNKDYLSEFPRHTRAFYKIQDGCDSFCTYCIIPYARGKPRSVPKKDVLKQIKLFDKAGHKEIIITGIHLGIYAKDMGEKEGLLNLLKLLEEESPVRRIRLSSIEPDEVDSKMIDFISGSSAINRHLHLPLQSGSDKILKSMGRRYRSDFFKDKVLEIKSKMPDCGLGIDVIAGFPGEKEEDFEKTHDLLHGIPVSYFHVFPYSPRRGTKAYDFEDRVNSKIVKERCARLRALGKEKRISFMSSLLGTVQSVLIESKKEPKTSLERGFTRNYIEALIIGTKSKRIQNKEVSVLLEKREKERVMAKLV